MAYKMKVEKVEYMNGFKVIHRVPDITEEERELIKQDILQKMYRDFKDKVETKEKGTIAENSMSYSIDSSVIYEEEDDEEVL